MEPPVGEQKQNQADQSSRPQEAGPGKGKESLESRDISETNSRQGGCLDSTPDGNTVIGQFTEKQGFGPSTRIEEAHVNAAGRSPGETYEESNGVDDKLSSCTVDGEADVEEGLQSNRLCGPHPEVTDIVKECSSNVQIIQDNDNSYAAIREAEQLGSPEQKQLVSTHTQTCVCHVSPSDIPYAFNPQSWSCSTVNISENIPQIEYEQCFRIDREGIARGLLKRTRNVSERSVSFDLENETASNGANHVQPPVSVEQELYPVADDVVMTSSTVTDDDTQRLVDVAPPGGGRDKLYLVLALVGLVLCPLTGACAVKYSVRARRARLSGDLVGASHNRQKTFLLTAIGVILALVIALCGAYLAFSTSGKDLI